MKNEKRTTTNITTLAAAELAQVTGGFHQPRPLACPPPPPPPPDKCFTMCADGRGTNIPGTHNFG